MLCQWRPESRVTKDYDTYVLMIKCVDVVSLLASRKYFVSTTVYNKPTLNLGIGLVGFVVLVGFGNVVTT